MFRIIFIFLSFLHAETPQYSFVVPTNKPMIEMSKDGKIKWLAPKDDVARALMGTINEQNQRIAQFEGQYRLVEDFFRWSPKAASELGRFNADRKAALANAKSKPKK